MANITIPELNELTAPDGDDLLEVVDVSDTTQSLAGSSKRLKLDTLIGDSMDLSSAQTVTGVKTFPAGYGFIVPTPYTCKVRRTTTQSFANNTPTKITFNQVLSDPYSMYNAGTPTIVTTPNFSGIWKISYGIAFDANATGARHAYPVLNGGSHYQGQQSIPGFTGIGGRMSGSFEELLAPNSTIEIEGNQTSGGALNSLGNVCFLSVTLLYRTA
jgi:hypothetical protein